MILTGLLMLVGALIERLTEWPYLTYLGVFSFSLVICSWTAIVLINNFRK